MASLWSRTTAASGTGSRTPCSTGSRSPAAVGTISAITASGGPCFLPVGSSATISRQSRNCWAPTAAVVSTGPPTAAPFGSSRRSRSWVRAPVPATLRPASTQASAASTPAPPALVTMATFLPAGAGWFASRTAVSSSAPRLEVAMMPACSNRACRVISGAATAAVCEAAAR